MIQLEVFFDSLGDLEILQYGLPIGLNFALSMPEIEAILVEQGITKADLSLPTGDSLNDDFNALANLYIALKGLGFSSIDDFETLQDPVVLAAITDQAIADIFDAVFAFNLVSSNAEVMSGII